MVIFQKVKLGDHVKTLKGFAFKSAWYISEGGTPIIKASNFGKDFVNIGNFDRLSIEKTKDFFKYKVSMDDVLIQTVGSWPNNPASVVGKVIRCQKDVVGFLLNQNIVKIIPKESLDKKYLFFLLKDNNFKDFILRGARGAANQASITLEDILNFEFKLPSLEAQKNVASIISAYNDLIENNEKRIKALEEMAQLIYTEWFVKFNFPGHEKIKMADNGTEYGMIPDEWSVKRLGNKIQIKKGKNITQNTVKQGDIPVVAGGLKPAYFHDTPNTKKPVVTISASGANAGFTRLYFEDVWASDCSFIDKSVTDNVYYYYLYLNNRRSDITRLQRGSAQPHVYPKDLMDLKIIDPSINLVEEFEKKVSPLFDLIGTMKAKRNNLSKTRDLLIPQLVTGKREVKS